MNKRELKQRGKGLLALMLAFLMMLGTSMTVLAANTYELDASLSVGSLNPGDVLQGGDKIKTKTSSGRLIVIIGSTEYEGKMSSEDGTLSFELPAGKKYKVISYIPQDSKPNGYIYKISLEAIPLPQSGGGNAGSPEAVESLQEEAGNGGGQPHTHYYTWVTAREATKDVDGLEEYKCACGVVAEQVIMPAGQAVVKGFCKAVREAAADGSVSYDTKGFCTMSDKMVACLAERTDVTVELTFIYQKTPYRMIIPAGSDYSALLADEDMFYGYFYFADQIGAQIEPVS